MSIGRPRFGSPSAPHGRRMIHESFAVSCGRRDLNETRQPDTPGAIEAVDPDAQITR